METIGSEELTSKLMEKASGIMAYTRQVKALIKNNEIAEASVKKKSQKLEVKEKELQSLSLDLEERCQILEKEKANHDKLVEDNVKKRSQELEIKEKELQSLSLDLKKRCQIFEKEKAEAGDLKRLVEECTEELKSKKNELTVKLDSLKRTQREIELKEKQLKNLMAELGRRCSDARKADDCKKEFEGEIDKRKNELALVLDKIKESSKQFKAAETEASDWNARTEMFRLEVQAKETELNVLKKQVESEEKKLIQLKREITSAKSEASDMSVRSEKFKQEVEGKEKELDRLKNQIESAEKNLIQVNREMEESAKASAKQFVTVDEQLESKRRQVGIVSLELVSKEKELESVRESIKLSNSDHELKEQKVKSLNNQILICDQAIDMKTKELEEIQKLVEEKTRELGVMNNKLDFLKLTIQELSETLLSKVEKHKEISQAIDRMSSEMEEGTKGIKAGETKASELNARSQRFRQDVEEKKKELNQLQNRIESGEKTLFELKRLLEETAKGVKAAESVGSDLSAKSERLREEVKGKENELDRLKNLIESAEKNLIQFNREVVEVTQRRENILEVILSKILESGKQLVAVNEMLESQQKMLETRSAELITSDMALECVAESSKSFKFDLEAQEKRLQVLKNLITISSEQLDLKSKELEEVLKLIEGETKKLCDMRKQQPSVAPIIDNSQQKAAEADLVNELALMHHESSASFLHSEISIALRASPNPAELVLDLVQEVMSKDSGLEDSVVEILVLLFDEFAKFQGWEQSQLQLRATEVAILWKEKITTEGPKSSLESLAFLQFIVAYGLKKLINQEETVLLASSIAQYKQASTLFTSLALKPEMITEIANELIKQSQYIPAVRFICHFKLTKNFSPSNLIMKEITNLRRSVLEKRPTGFSQAKEEDAGRLRAILEVVADHELKIDLPGDLMAKLMVQRENSTPLVRCSVRL